MNTPAHVVANLLLLHRRPREAAGAVDAHGDRVTPVVTPAAPIVWGALVPDLPMVVFYAVEKGLLRRSESAIWGRDYFDPSWQVFFDLFNSLPLAACGAAVAMWLGSRAWSLFFFSVALHALFDLPLHHDDGHRHFLPLSDFRFESPISYWDPAHYGQWIGPIESALAIGGSLLLWRRFPDSPGRYWLLAVAGGYAVLWGWAVVFWMG